MNATILIPVLNEEKNLPALLKALEKFREEEIIFVDNASTDGSLELLKKFSAGKKFVRVLEEPNRGFAEPLNLGLQFARGENILFLDADAIPDKNWVKKMTKALTTSDLVVGETKSLLPPKPSVYGKLAKTLFHQHSFRTAHALGHTLPWGPTCNLGARRSWFTKVGPFSSAATSAFDIDWCWRAVLAGARISFAKDALVHHWRRNDRSQLLQQFQRYGSGEAWIRRTYAFLVEEATTNLDALELALEAFSRLQSGTKAQKNEALSEVAAAFAIGVHQGFERPHCPCPLERGLPSAPVSWVSGKNLRTIFVPGRGITQLSGKMAQIWDFWKAGATKVEIQKKFCSLFKMKQGEAEEMVNEFLEAFSPAPLWKKL